MNDFVIGLDLGQAQDYTALAIIEKVPQSAMEEVVRKNGNMTYRKMERVEKPAHLHCRHLERLDLGTLYPTIVDKVGGMMQSPVLRGAPLVIDGTGVGRPVVDMFNQAGLKPIPVTITGGQHVTHERGYWHVPKRDLVTTVQAALQADRLGFAEGMPLFAVLTDEMLKFEVKITESGHDIYGSWREGAHDDLLLALMLACWWAERPPPHRIENGSVSMRSFDFHNSGVFYNGRKFNS